MRYLRLKGAYGLFASLAIGLFFVLLPADLEAQVVDTTAPELVDFDFDPSKYRKRASVAVTPLTLPGGRSNGELQAANDRLLEYIHRRPSPHARTDPASMPDTPSNSLPTAVVSQ